MQQNFLSLPTATMRCIIGLLQGIVLYLLYKAATQSPMFWPATQPTIFMPMLMVSFFIPFLIVQGMNNVRPKTLLIWRISAFVILCAISYYAAYRQFSSDINPEILATTPWEFLMPPWALVFATSVALFIAHTLVSSGDQDRKLMAHYSTYFDIAWKLAIQLIFSLLFTLFFWLLLFLGRALFEVIGLHFFDKLISKPWFSIPATTLAITVALHITDVHVDIVRGVRTLSLSLLSWLLPVITIIISIFLCSLFVTGLTPLWKTGHASALLIAGSIILIILINTVYQDGQHEKPIPTVQRYTATVAACLLLPLIVLAMYSLGLRVQQYGWSVQRIVAAVMMLLVACYAVGYAWAAIMPVRSGQWFKQIERWNIATAILILVAYLALFTPVADPARLMVNNQLARLQAGKVAPEKFDFNALRSQGVRFGQQALQNLSVTTQGPQSNFVRTQAKAALAIKNTTAMPNTPLKPEEKRQLIIVHTVDGQLPSSFLSQNWKFEDSGGPLPLCIYNGSETCDAWIMQGATNVSMILLLDRNGFTGFQQNAQGTWVIVGTWSFRYSCREKLRERAKQGQFKLVPPQAPPRPDIEIMGLRLQFYPRMFYAKCPANI